MPITSVHCQVLGTNVTRVTDLGGTITQIICTYLDQPTGSCRIKQATLAAVPLAPLLGRVGSHTLAGHGPLCDLR